MRILIYLLFFFAGICDIKFKNYVTNFIFS